MYSIQKYKINELLAISILIIYYYIFKVKGKKNDTYFNSKYWLGVSQNVIKYLIPLQIGAGIGGLIWYKYMRDNPPDKGFLSIMFLNNYMFDILVCIFLIGSILWPISLLQKNIIENKTLIKSLLCCSGLFIAALSGILMQAGSFECDNISPIALLGITIFNVTIILNDGIGWSSRLLYQTIHK
jgi:hypothetical protein